jgi:hypothetical protein
VLVIGNAAVNFVMVVLILAVLIGLVTRLLAARTASPRVDASSAGAAEEGDRSPDCPVVTPPVQGTPTCA